MRDATQGCSHSPLPSSATAFQTGTAGQSAGQADFTPKRKKRAVFWGLRFAVVLFIAFYLKISLQ